VHPPTSAVLIFFTLYDSMAYANAGIGSELMSTGRDGFCIRALRTAAGNYLMKLKISLIKLLLPAVVIALVCTDISFLIAREFPIMDDYVYAKRFPLKNIKNTEIIFVDSSDQTFKTLGTPVEEKGWLPFTRSMYIEVFSRILKGNPKVLGVDIFYDGVKDLKDDLKFIKMLESAKNNVVLAVFSDELDKFLLFKNNSDNSGRFYKGNENISIGNIRIMYPSSYGGETKLIIEPVHEKTIWYNSFPIEVARIYLNSEFDAYPSADTSESSSASASAKTFNSPPYATMGDTKIPTDTQYCRKVMLINYIGGFEVFQTIPFEKIKDTDPAVFKDKIVLIGSSSKTVGDIHNSPLSPETPGTLVLANAIDTIVNRRFITPMNMPHQAAHVFLLCMAVIILNFYTRKTLCMSLTVVTIIGVKIITDALFYHHGIYVLFAPLALGAVMSAFFAALLKIHMDASAPAAILNPKAGK
jgi:CHASE2 domain-containing sensor protein